MRRQLGSYNDQYMKTYIFPKSLRRATKGYELWSSKVCEGDHMIWSLSRVEYACKNFDPLRGITFGLFSHHVFRMKFDPLSYQWLHRKSKVDQRSFFEQFESESNFIFRTRDQKISRKYVMPRKWIKVLACISNTW